jgi:hypothetical protein
MPKATRLLTLMVIGSCLAGCSLAPVYNIKVNGYTEPGTVRPIKPGGSFFVIANQEAKNPLLEAEVKDKITKLLLSHGYPHTTFEKADYYLFFAYGMGEPRSVSVVVPDYYGSLGWGMGCGWGPGYCGWGGPAFCLTVPPWGAYAADTTIYDRWLLINVVDGPVYRIRQLSQPVWVGEARSTGASSDLRTVLNYLLVADFKEFGKNTGKAISLDLKEHDPAVFSLTH